MSRKTLNPHGKFKVFRDARMLDIETSIAEGMRHRVGLASPLPMANEARKSAEGFLVKAQSLTYLARCGFAAIGNDIRCHSSAEFAVALIDVLNGLFAFFFRRKIEIDVRPFPTALAQKTFEEQLHADRIDGRDFECITDS